MCEDDQRGLMLRQIIETAITLISSEEDGDAPGVGAGVVADEGNEEGNNDHDEGGAPLVRTILTTPLLEKEEENTKKKECVRG